MPTDSSESAGSETIHVTVSAGSGAAGVAWAHRPGNTSPDQPTALLPAAVTPTVIADLTAAERHVPFPILVPDMPAFTAASTRISLNEHIPSLNIGWSYPEKQMIMLRETAKIRIGSGARWEATTYRDRQLYVRTPTQTVQEAPAAPSRAHYQIAVQYPSTGVHLGGAVPLELLFEIASRLVPLPPSKSPTDIA
ncbi:DUF4245 family protein [Qaidamihabitans albus]|uniref:DUF4245 family protein n=1 Tax=Qaidamihabitans albus TaxID=2795733 RepID=UPI0018F13C69|nr:DUF4245 family protein [Qaidamihabitans albus]